MSSMHMQEEIDYFLHQQVEQPSAGEQPQHIKMEQPHHIKMEQLPQMQPMPGHSKSPIDDIDGDIPIPTKDDEGKDVFVCDSCGALFAYSYSLLAHKRHKCHSGKGEFKCDLCHKRFNFPSQLQRHMPTHTGEKPFQCHHCPKAFNESSNLKQHMLIHTDQKPFCCDFATCEKRFRSASNLKVHMRTHTKERPYICEFTGCGKRFVSAGDLKRHFRIHTKERPYICQYCGKSFIQGPYLNIHIRSHTKEKPYTCTHCGKAFSRTSTLKIHLRLHTGKKQFKCGPCNKTFESANNLHMHTAIMHPKEPKSSPQSPSISTSSQPPMQQMGQQMSAVGDYGGYMQSLMYDCEVPCGTLPNGQTVPLTGRNASIIRPRAKRPEGTPLSPDFIPQRDKMQGMQGVPLGAMVTETALFSTPPIPSDFYPPAAMHLTDLGDLNQHKMPPLGHMPLPPHHILQHMPPHMMHPMTPPPHMMPLDHEHHQIMTSQHLVNTQHMMHHDNKMLYHDNLSTSLSSVHNLLDERGVMRHSPNQHSVFKPYNDNMGEYQEDIKPTL